MPNYETAKTAFERLMTIMDELRAGCPWDRKQTLESLRHLTIEETYELSEAIQDHDMEELRGELGDLMLHMVFYSKIAEEQSAFEVTDVLNAVCDKLVRRHPHIYGDVDVNNAEEVSANWEEIKRRENGGQRRSVLAGVPKSLPALLKAYRMQDKVASYGFDWEQPADMIDKLQEELTEFREEVEADTRDETKVTAEFGDLLFSLVNYARYVGVNPEDALEATNRKFRTRFTHIEQRAEAAGKELQAMSLSEMESYWQEAKSLA